MKKFSKTILSLVLVISMLLSLGMTTFAENPGVISSHVEFEVTDAGVSAKAFVRDLAAKYSYDASAVTESFDGYTCDSGDWGQLIFAAYDKDGRITGVSVNTGLNRILKTDPVQVPADGSAKAFVWKSITKEVISEIALYKKSGYDFEDVLDTLEITFGGESFESFVGTAFDKATTTYNAGALASLPDIKATVKDNATHITAYQTETAYIVEVKSTVGMGNQTFATKTNKATVDVTANRPSYTDSRKYVINYTTTAPTATKINPATDIYHAGGDENRWSGYNIAKSTFGTVSSAGFKNVASAEIPFTGPATKVDVTINHDLYQNVFIIVRPKNGSNGINNKVIVADAEGTALETTENNRSYKSFSIDGDTVTREFYKKSSTNPVTFTPPSGDATTFYVGYEFNDDSTRGDTGADIANRKSIDFGIHVAYTNNTIKNAEYIPFDLGNNHATEGGTFSFYVGQDAIVEVYARHTADGYGAHLWHTNATSQFDLSKIEIKANDDVVTPVAKDEYVLTTYGAGFTTKSDFNADYVAYYDLTLAYFDYKGYIAGLDYYYDEAAESFKPYGWVERFAVNNGNYNAGENWINSTIASGLNKWGMIVISATGTNSQFLSSANVSTIIANPKNVAYLWNSDGTLKSREELKGLFEAGYIAPKAPEFEHGASNRVFAKEFQAYVDELNNKHSSTYTWPTGWTTGAELNNKIYTFVPGTSTADEFKKICEDRTLAVTDYETLLELEGSTLINACHEWSNGRPTILSNHNGAYGGATEATFDTPFYSFTVNQDSEVIVVLPNNRSFSRTPNNVADNWVPITAQVYGAIVMNSAYSGWFPTENTNVGVRYAEKGETVTIRVPMDGVRPLVFVRPL